MFIGRKEELQVLNSLKEQKSALIEEFGKKFDRFINIQGLGPTQNNNIRVQLHHFGQRIAEIFDRKKVIFEDWIEANILQNAKWSANRSGSSFRIIWLFAT